MPRLPLILAALLLAPLAVALLCEWCAVECDDPDEWQDPHDVKEQT